MPAFASMTNYDPVSEGGGLRGDDFWLRLRLIVPSAAKQSPEFSLRECPGFSLTVPFHPIHNFSKFSAGI
jgi:hypothetical protein